MSAATRSAGASGLAFVLHRRDYGNTSLLVELFSAGQGRFAAVARGARRGRAPLAALLQPFQALWVSTRGRGEVRTLSGCEEAARALALSGESLLCGFYLNELIERLLARYDPHPDLYLFYQAALAALAAGDDRETLLRRFELRLLDELGYGLGLDSEGLHGAALDPAARYGYSTAMGLQPLVPGVAESPAGQAADTAVSGATLLALTRDVTLASEQRGEARWLLRRALAPLLGGRPLRTRQLYRQWYGVRERCGEARPE